VKWWCAFCLWAKVPYRYTRSFCPLRFKETLLCPSSTENDYLAKGDIGNEPGPSYWKVSNKNWTRNSKYEGHSAGWPWNPMRWAADKKWQRKIKVISVTGLGVLYDCEMLRNPHFSRRSVNRWRSSCQPFAPATLFLRVDFILIISIRGWVNPKEIVQLEGLGNIKRSMTPLGIEIRNPKSLGVTTALFLFFCIMKNFTVPKYFRLYGERM
jgi:hypothetical protein